MPLVCQIGVFHGPGIEPFLPRSFGLGSALDRGAEMGHGLFGKIKLLVRVPAKILLGQLHLVRAQGGAVGFAAARLMGGAVADGGVNHDE